jgi:hypothetical protein
MSSAEEDEVTQVAPPQLAPSVRVAEAPPERTEDLPAPPLAGPAPVVLEPAESVTEMRAMVTPAPGAAESLTDLPDLRVLLGEATPEPTAELPPPPSPSPSSPPPVPAAARRPADLHELTNLPDMPGVEPEIATEPGGVPVLAPAPRPEPEPEPAPEIESGPGPEPEPMPEPPALPAPELERPASGPLPAMSQAARETAKMTRFRASRTTLADTGMRQEEIARGHAFIKLLVAIIGVTGTLLLVIDGDPTAEAIAAMGLVYTLGAFTWFLYRVRDVGSYHVGSLLFLIVSSLLASYTTVYLWGVSSPMPVIFALSIAFIGHSVNPTIALSGYVTCALAQLGLTLLIATGLLRDRALIPLASLGTAEVVVSQLIVHSMYLCGLLVARYNRQMAQKTLGELERAAVEVARRDLLLQEARQELSNALRVGAYGRYTGQVMGKHRLGMLLGHGAVGEVYEAQDLETGDVAAVKLLHGHAMAEERQVQRFLREAENASRLHSPHVVRMYDHGRAPDGSHYLAMERLHGRNLAEHLRVYERMPLREVVTLVEHVGEGLQAAWAAGIVHRDIKPQNIFRCQEPHAPAVWKVLDFGVSKMAHQGNTLTQGNIIGTPSYMAPEQVEGKQIDHRADLFALAAVAYRALTGRPAFGGDRLPIVLYRVVYGMPEAPSRMAGVPADVDLVFARALAKHPDDRFASTMELARALAQAARAELPEPLRAQARGLVRKHPWGTLLGPPGQRPLRSS